MQVGAGARPLHPVFLLASAISRSPATAACAWSRSKAAALDIACNMPVSAGMKVFTESDEVKAHRKAILQFITLNHPGGLRHLRQGRRVLAAGLSLHLQRRAFAVARREGRVDQVLQPVEPHPARQRALHPVPALHALHARGVEVDGARRRTPRATSRTFGRSKTVRWATTRIRTTSSTSARWAHCCRASSCTRRASGT